MNLSAKVLSVKKDIHVPKSHQELIKRFSLEYVHKDDFEYVIYKYLARSQVLREEADYNAFDSIDEVKAQRIINQVEKFLKESERFL